ncbi:MAG: RidA family protein [Clostridia bacterium]|nr:RidA family protein [Clostridia bacterium]
MKIIVAKDAPDAIGPYSHGVATKCMLFTSGQLPIDKNTGAFAEGGIQGQTEQSIKNLKAVLNAGGCDLGDVVKTTVYLSDMKNFGAMNEVYARYFTENFPARTCVEVARLPKDALVEIEAIAFCHKD